MANELEYKNKPLVTIGILNYNCKKYLKKCVDSYLNQTYKNLEIIIIDDCSTDGSIEAILELEEQYENIRAIFHETNSGGPSKGVNEVITEAKGKYFQWIASDDYVSSNLIQKYVDYLETTNKDYVYCNLNIVNDNDAVTSRWNYVLPNPSQLITKVFSKGTAGIQINGLFRTEFFNKNNLYWTRYRNNEYSSDTINSLQFTKNGMTFGLINENLFNYRLHSANYSRNIEKRIKGKVAVYDYIIKNFNEELYLPNIEWNKYNNRKQLKNYVIALHYYNKIMWYLGLNGFRIPYHANCSISKEKVKECMSVFIDEGLQYIEEGLKQGDIYSDKLLELRKMYLDLEIS